MTASPPRAPQRPVVHELHGDRRVDEYAWLRNRDDPEVIAHLKAENAHTEAYTGHLEPLRERLYTEIVARIEETDVSAPVADGPWEYLTRTVEGSQYGILCRRPLGGGTEHVVLDQNQLATGLEYLHVGDIEISPDQRLVAYTVDTSGGERHVLRVRDIESGKDLDDVVENVYYSVAWSSDSRTLYYTRPDQAMRPHQLLRHTLGTAPGEDTVVLQEDDERFFVGVERSRSGGVLIVALASQVTTEVHLIDAAEPGAAPEVVEPRRQGVEYSVDHHRHGEVENLFVVTNDGAENFRLMVTPRDRPGRANWTEVVGNRANVKLEGIDVFAGHIALYERGGAVCDIRLLPLRDGVADSSALLAIPQPEDVHAAGPADNREWAPSSLRFAYTSLVTPPSIVEYDIAAGKRTVLKQQAVLGGYDPANYVSERRWATAADGVRVPISVVHHRDTPRDGTAPCLLYGYGAYEISRDPAFSSLRLSLLDRGFVFALAHVRGGGEMGRPWYEDGKLLRKRNTFTDFIACADALVTDGLTSHARLAIRGGSAGGLLIGAVVNLRPDLAAAAVAEVPFVDSLTTMLDDTLPLTVIEYEEWGNPNELSTYEYMRGYSPYDNVAPADHPAILAMGGLNDPRVGFWEPAKWVARLRDRTTGTRPVLLRTELGAGHAGPSGRYEAWRREAFITAFLLDTVPGWHEASDQTV